MELLKDKIKDSYRQLQLIAQQDYKIKQGTCEHWRKREIH